jgi:hypothetical protein
MEAIVENNPHMVDARKAPQTSENFYDFSSQELFFTPTRPGKRRWEAFLLAVRLSEPDRLLRTIDVNPPTGRHLNKKPSLLASAFHK